MSSEKRLIIFTVVTFVSILGVQYGMQALGLVPPPPPPKKLQAPVAQAKNEPGKADPKGVDVKPDALADASKKDVSGAADKDKPKPELKLPKAKLFEPSELVLGSLKKGNPYLMELRLDQKGGGVSSLSSSKYEGEFVEGKKKHRPLDLLKYDALTPPSLAMTLRIPTKPGAGVDAEAAAEVGIGATAPGGAELPLDGETWEVVAEAGKLVVQKATKVINGKPVEGQQISFRTKVDGQGLVITKTFRLFPGEEGFEVSLTFESPEKTNSVVYKLLGPHGIPIEGEWYTGTFRDAVFGQIDGATTKVVTLSAYDIAKRGRENPERFQTQPLRFAGIENQYFAAVLEPVLKPQEERWDEEWTPVILHDDVENRQKSDIGVELVSKSLAVGPNVPVTHTYRVFAGPKTVDALTPFGAEDLAAYRKSNWIPLAPFFARAIITPLLGATYNLTRFVAGLWGGKTGNYGLAIILMTMAVRLAMFPLGRKQAMAAKKMQDLQPYLKEIQEKYKDDKERQTKETWALWKRHGVNPAGGCWPALIQMPIFVGLWQALNNSVALRHAPFLYIENLAAPDMLFKFPTEIPFLGNYFNVLPFVVVALMLVQTKLFSPPATTPEAEAQQKMMKYMMVFMAFMFYKVPSGLGIYFITSSLWQICERLLLPKVTSVSALKPASDDLKELGDGNHLPAKPPKPPGKLQKFMARVLEEAKNDKTYRNIVGEKNKGLEPPDRNRDGRDKGKPRPRPERRR